MVLTHTNIFLLGLSFDRPKKPHREKLLPSPEDKNKYLDDAKKFAKSIAEKMVEPEGKAVIICMVYLLIIFIVIIHIN